MNLRSVPILSARRARSRPPFHGGSPGMDPDGAAAWPPCSRPRALTCARPARREAPERKARRPRADPDHREARNIESPEEAALRPIEKVPERSRPIQAIPERSAV
jgi:hypothetical protein